VARAPEFNQAARNVACLAHLISNRPQGGPEEPISANFVLLAPEYRIKEGVFRRAMDRNEIVAAVRRRAVDSDQAALDWCEHCFEPIVEKCSITVSSWENVLASIRDADPESEGLAKFYEQCLKYNPFRRAV
jgi:hypothetical protein